MHVSWDNAPNNDPGSRLAQYEFQEKQLGDAILYLSLGFLLECPRASRSRNYLPGHLLSYILILRRKFQNMELIRVSNHFARDEFMDIF